MPQGPGKLSRTATLVAENALERFSNQEKSGSLALKVLEHSSSSVIAVADVSSTPVVLEGICKTDILVAIDQNPVGGMSAADVSRLLEQAGNRDVTMTFLAVLKSRNPVGRAKRKSGTKSGAKSAKPPRAPLSSSSCGMHSSAIPSVPSNSSRQEHVQTKLQSEGQLNLHLGEKNQTEKLYVQSHCKFFTISGATLGFSVVRAHDQIDRVTSASRMTSRCSSTNEYLQRNEALIQFNDKLTCTFRRQKHMLRALKASPRPLHLVFARVGSDFRRINNYFKWKNEHGKAQAKGAIVVSNKRNIDASALGEDVADHSLGEIAAENCQNSFARPKKRICVGTRPFAQDKSVHDQNVSAPDGMLLAGNEPKSAFVAHAVSEHGANAVPDAIVERDGHASHDVTSKTCLSDSAEDARPAENKATHCGRKDDAFSVKSDDVQANGNGKRTLGDHKTVRTAGRQVNRDDMTTKTEVVYGGLTW